ncbi:hypothetical protein [Alkalihalobacillus sp. TS-13]|uniref:hypothetical protein n=1 Tax=Alkalihalobacillus sp. TS-13 TaxID=2842455 RepID=UPI001C881AF7|nr:hypothetical protein [Alkalihalobacillus sp. TS-13]
MCGFVGCVSDQQQEIDAYEIRQLKGMTNLITHRGPDDEGFFMTQYISNFFYGKINRHMFYMKRRHPVARYFKDRLYTN